MRAAVRRRLLGRRLRLDLATQWSDPAAATRAGLVSRVIAVGAESTGTTTVSRRVAEHYRGRDGIWAATEWVAEYGREYTEIQWSAAIGATRAVGAGTDQPGRARGPDRVARVDLRYGFLRHRNLGAALTR